MTYRAILILGFSFFIISNTMSQSRLEANTFIRTFHTTENLGETYPHLLRARISMQTLDFENALLHADNAIAQNPGSAESYLVRAEIKRKSGMESDGAIDFSIANRLNPYAADIFGYNGRMGIINTIYFQPKEFLLELGIQYHIEHYYNYLEEVDVVEKMDTISVILSMIETGEFDDALEWLSLIPSPENDEMVALLYDLEGAILLEKGMYQEASPLFEIATALNPEFALSWYNLGRLSLSIGQYDEAREFFNKAIELDKDFIGAYFQHALLSKKEGKNKEAIKDYDRIIKLNGNFLIEAYVNRGLAYKAEGDYTKAFNDLDIAIDMSPENPHLYKNRGNLFLLFGATEKAILDFSKAVELDNDFSEAYFNRAIARIILLDYIDACEDLELSIDLGYEIGSEYLSFFCID